MNSSFGRINKALRDDFRKAFSSKSNKAVFESFRKYLQYIEDDNEDYRHLFLTKNPLVEKKENDYFVKEFNENCISFLKDTIKNYKNAHPYDSTLSEAQLYIGVGYEFGLFGLSQNPILAFHYYSASAQQNNPLATFRLAQCFEKGVGKPKNHTNSLDFYRCSAKLGYVQGMHTYGSILLRGDLNNTRDLQSGLFYLKNATRKADTNYPFPYYDLAQCFETNVGPSEIESDNCYAFKLYLRGANLGCPNCQYRIAKCYEYGELEQKRNISEAIHWYKKSAELGQIDARVTYSRYLFTGINGILKQNSARSYYWAHRAAIRGHSQGAYYVGEFVENGCGTKKSMFLSLWWYTIAAEYGNTKAQSKMKALRFKVNQKNEGIKESKCCGCFF